VGPLLAVHVLGNRPKELRVGVCLHCSGHGNGTVKGTIELEIVVTERDEFLCGKIIGERSLNFHDARNKATTRTARGK